MFDCDTQVVREREVTAQWPRNKK